MNRKMRGKVNRFRVFRVLKDLTGSNILPTVNDVHLDLPDLNIVTIRKHMKALEGSNGLPLVNRANGRVGGNNKGRVSVDRILAGKHQWRE